MVFWKNVAKLTVAAFAGAFVAIAALVVLGFATGRLTGEKMTAMVKVLRGEPIASGRRPGLPKDLTGRYEMEALEEARRAVEDLRQQEEFLVLKLNERHGEMRKLEADAASIRKELVDRAEACFTAEKAFEEKRSSYEAQLRSAGFRKLVTALQNMSEKDAAKLLYDWDTGQAAELLKALENDQRGRVIVEIAKRDRLPENADEEAKAAKLMKMIWQNSPDAVTLKAE